MRMLFDYIIVGFVWAFLFVATRSAIREYKIYRLRREWNNCQ